MSCDPCYMRLGDCGLCDGSPVCVPRYLCVNVKVTPGPYSESPCCKELSFRMAGGISSFPGGAAGCGWTGDGSCGSDVGIGFDIRLSADDYGQCITTVIAQFVGGPLITTYPGIVYNFTFTITDEPGNVFVVTIGGVVPGVTGSGKRALIVNPLFDIHCSQCYCGECTPGQLCVLFQFSPAMAGSTNPFCGICKSAQIFIYDPLLCSYVGEPFVCDGKTYVVELKYDRHHTSCVILGKITGPNLANHGRGMPGFCNIGCIDFGLPIDGVAAEPTVENPDSVKCRENSNDLLHGSPHAARPQRYDMAPLETSVTLYVHDPLTDLLAEAGSLTISDATCGTTICLADFPFCYGGCPEFAKVFSPNTMPCPEVTLTATVIAPNCAYDGAACTLKHNPVCPTDGFIAQGGTVPEHCVQWCGTLRFECADTSAVEVQVLFWSSLRQCGDGDNELPFSYRLGTPWGTLSCDGIGMGPTQYPVGPHSPIAAACSPFVIDFEIPVICKGVGEPGSVVNVPFCDGDTCTSIKIRVTM